MRLTRRRKHLLCFNATLGGLAALQASANIVQPYIPGSVYAWGLLLLTVGNAMLFILHKDEENEEGKCK